MTAKITSTGTELHAVKSNRWANLVTENACELHPAYEADNCPSCGTCAQMSH